MAIELRDLAITYYPIPKSGSSSIKFMLLALDRKEGTLSDPDNDVHQHLATNYVDPSLPVYDGHKGKFTIVRDPLERLLSAYSNRISEAGVLTRPTANKETLERFSLPVDPDLDTFILNIEKYCACSWEVRFHVASPRYFTGSSLFLFDRVFKFEQIDQVAAFLSSASGRTFEIPRLQSSGRRCSPSDLSPAARAKAMRFCRYDYGFLVDYYDPQKWGGIPQGDPGDPSTLHVFADPAALRDGRIVYPRTPRNLMNFMAKRSLEERKVFF